jgi:hypothetical protein
LPDRKKIPVPKNILLWVKAGGRCEFSGCNKILYHDDFLPFKEHKIADKAHIVANSPKGARGDPVYSSVLATDINNFMLLCKDCHDRIDTNENLFSVECLKQMKRLHEERIERVTGISVNNKTTVITYWANISKQKNSIDINNIMNAVIADEKYPIDSDPVDLSLPGHESYDNEELFWVIEERNLEKRFDAKLKDMIADKSKNMLYSLFALAPIPLLIKLGSLFTDKTNVHVFQRHREPKDTWEWLNDSDELIFLIDEPKDISTNVVLVLSISDTISLEDVIKVIGDDVSIWTIKIVNPNNDCIRSKKDLHSFREIFRTTLRRIKTTHGTDKLINIFPAIPLSVAVEMGRVWMPKADLPMVIYDRNRGKDLSFKKILEIGVENE